VLPLDNQLKVIDIAKTPFAVSGRNFLVALYLTPGVSGEERWSLFESRVLFDEGNPYLHRKVLPSDV